MRVYHKTPREVMVKRNQDPEPWKVTSFYAVVHGEYDKTPEGKPIEGTEKPGKFISLNVVDERGFEHFADYSQISEVPPSGPPASQPPGVQG